MIGISHKLNRLDRKLSTLFNFNKVQALKWILLGILSALTLSCASGIRIEAPPISLQRVEKILVENLPGGGARYRSINGREFKSHYFSPYGDMPDAQIMYVRDTAHAVILGDRRPYAVSVKVTREKRQPNGTYVEVGEDREGAARLAEVLKRELDKGRRERNLVDDFRVF